MKILGGEYSWYCQRCRGYASFLALTLQRYDFRGDGVQDWSGWRVKVDRFEYRRTPHDIAPCSGWGM